MEVAKLRRGILTLRRKYVPDLLKEAWMKVCRPSDALMNPGQKLSEASKEAPVEKDDNVL